MDAEHSASSTLPWIWVIEALARMKEVDISVLTDLVVKMPEMADDLGKDVRDILSLRILEDFQVQQLGNLTASFTGPIPNSEFGQSTDHEDILQFLLQKISLFTVRKEGSETLNSYIQTFIQNTRCSLTKCSLERLKDEIQEGHPILESLKERSGLSSNNLSANRTSLSGSLKNHETWSNSVSHKVKQRVHGDQVVSMEEDLTLSQSAYPNHCSQDPINTSHVSTRCNGIDPTSNDKLPQHLDDGNNPKDESDSHLHIAKKAKYAVNVTNEVTGQLSEAMVSNELLENLVEAGPKMKIISKVDELNRLRSKEDSHGQCSGKGNFSKDDDNDHPIEPLVCSLRDRNEKEIIDDVETDGDSDGFDVEKIDIETQKQHFISTFIEDTISTTQKSDLNLCMKCNGDGPLLVCSTRTCRIGVHPSCLGFAAPVDCKPFYCPFCSYSNAISEYLEAKKKSSLARHSLSSFLRFENKSQPKVNSKRCVLEEKYSYTHNKQQCGTNKDRQQKEPLESEAGRMTSHASFDVMATRIEEKHDGPERMTEQISKNGDCQQANSNLCRELVVYVEQGKKQYVSQQVKVERAEVSNNDDIEETSLSDVSASNFRVRYRNKRRENTCPSIPPSRRIKSLWSTAEEKMLREGVNRLSSVHDRTIPWKKILEFGANVFQKSRTTVDLKDKWRNMCNKKSPTMKRKV